MVDLEQRAPNAKEMADVSSPTIASDWLRRSHPGTCGKTPSWYEGDCLHGSSGSYRLTDTPSLESAAAFCLRACAFCDRCRYVSVSRTWRDCSWYHDCAALDADIPKVWSGPSLAAWSSALRCSGANESARHGREARRALLDDGISRRYDDWSRRLGVPRSALEGSTVLDEDNNQQGPALRRFLRKLYAKLPVRVAVVGGSLTFGHGVDRSEDRWPDQMRRALEEIWNTSVAVHNAAMPATTAGFGALCYDTLVPFRVDLTILEYSHNTAEPAKMEMLLLAARRHAGAVLVVDYSHVHSARRFHKCAAQAAVQSEPRCPELATVRTFEPARHVRFYPFLRASGLPVVSWAALGPWLAQSGPRFLMSHVARDAIHLSPRGYGLLSGLVVHFVKQAAVRHSSVAAPGARPRRGSTCRSSRLEDRILGAGSQQRATCTIGSELQSLVMPCSARDPACAWRFAVERGKPGLLATAVGSILELRLHGLDGSSNTARLAPGRRPRAAAAPLNAAVRDHALNSSALAHLVYLQSYEHMGVAQISCAAGCTCEPLVIDAHSTARRDSLETVARPLRVHWGAGSRACALRATVMPRTSSGEHKFKVTALVVTPPHMDEAAAAVADLQDFVDSQPRALIERVTSRYSTQ